MRAVFDTNTVVSALLRRTSTPRQALDRALAVGVVIQSAATYEELYEVLVRPKFDPYVSLVDRMAFLVSFAERCEFIHVPESAEVSRDPSDDKFLGLAVAGGATVIVTGDADLLSLGTHEGIPIVTASEFVSEE